MVIGDYLSDEQKRQYIHSRLVPGAVIYRFCDFTKPPKPKYLLVVQVQEKIAVLVINSTINRFTQSHKYLLDSQVSVDQTSHTFLDHDSFINCSEAEYLDTTDLIEEIMADMDKIKGKITNQLKAAVIVTIQDSFTLSPAEIASLVASLSI